MPNRRNSPKTTYTRLSPNCSNPRRSAIRRLTPHCVAGNLTVEATLGLDRFARYDPTQGASCNYAIGSDGRVGLGVEETKRAWTTSSSVNDNEAITFEIANNSGAPDWRMSDAAINAWLDLAVEIATFYGFRKVVYQTKPSTVTTAQVEQWIKTWATDDVMIITLHCWFTNKTCPGPYFTRQLPWLVREMNKRLAGQEAEAFVGECTVPPTNPSIVPNLQSFTPYLATINVAALNVRKGPGTSYPVVTVLRNDKNAYTIIEEMTGPGATMWCKLKSGIGWVSKDFISKK